MQCKTVWLQSSSGKCTNRAFCSKKLLYILNGICFKLCLLLLAYPTGWGNISNNCCSTSLTIMLLTLHQTSRTGHAEAKACTTQLPVQEKVSIH